MDKAEKGLEMKEREVFGKCGDYKRLHLKKALLKRGMGEPPALFRRRNGREGSMLKR